MQSYLQWVPKSRPLMRVQEGPLWHPWYSEKAKAWPAIAAEATSTQCLFSGEGLAGQGRGSCVSLLAWKMCPKGRARYSGRWALPRKVRGSTNTEKVKKKNKNVQCSVPFGLPPKSEHILLPKSIFLTCFHNIGHHPLWTGSILSLTINWYLLPGKWSRHYNESQISFSSFLIFPNGLLVITTSGYEFPHQAGSLKIQATETKFG